MALDASPQNPGGQRNPFTNETDAQDFAPLDKWAAVQPHWESVDRAGKDFFLSQPMTAGTLRLLRVPRDVAGTSLPGQETVIRGGVVMSRVLWVLTIVVCTGANRGVAQEARTTRDAPPRAAVEVDQVRANAPAPRERAARTSRTRSVTRRSPEAAAARSRAVAEKAPQRKTTVIRLKYSPAINVADTISQYLKSERELRQEYAPRQSGPDVFVVADAVTNSLIISAAPRDFEEVKELLELLDARPPMLSLQILIAEIAYEGEAPKEADELVLKASGDGVDATIRELKKRGTLRVLARPQIATLDNQPAFIKISQRKPRITGSSSSSRGRVNSVTLEDVGLTLGVTPRISADGQVTMEIDIEQSRLAPEKEGVAVSVSEGEVVRSPEVEIVNVQTTVRVHDGRSLVLGGLIRKSKTGWRELLIVVTPVVRFGD